MDTLFLPIAANSTVQSVEMVVVSFKAFCNQKSLTNGKSPCVVRSTHGRTFQAIQLIIVRPEGLSHTKRQSSLNRANIVSIDLSSFGLIWWSQRAAQVRSGRRVQLIEACSSSEQLPGILRFLGTERCTRQWRCLQRAQERLLKRPVLEQCEDPR